MSQKCPLCEKNKPKESLFCEDCSKKISSDFEINIDNKDKSYKNNNIVAEQSEEVDTKSFQEKKKVVDKKETAIPKYEPIEKNYPKSGGKSGKSLFWILIGIVLLAGAFLIYNKTTLSGNLEQRAWESALSENSVSGYLDFIKSHPDGKYFNEAQDALLKLKEDEAEIWEKLKHSDSINELIYFSRQHENSLYIPLVRMRIDSLSWVSALRQNSTESYLEYINNSESGLLNGDYMSLAYRKYEMLSRQTLSNIDEMDSIGVTINESFPGSP
ncbi:hypothetical protein [Lascolabacillus massiliensis]|jgi:hypothetical protein|uniref:hypothetical protein n=1 Tax=Lascolabacillus massiliensis TaxID=1627894 RepID=UPI0006B39335|nr:hypothetical protein [Lascolabacillus massiliensis]MDI9625835.1 hypothetical protein [Bacteroidota bacterium]TAH61753.1 MAG: hypothetical protein EWM46_03575 [Fermentimonas caenicola]